MTLPGNSNVKFGTSGLRGIAVDLLDGPAASHIAAFLQNFAGPGVPVLIGCDKRDSSMQLCAQAVSVANALQLPANFVGVVPTPCLAFAASRQNAVTIMVTGSHIPGDRNGVKFYRQEGEITKADEETISKGAAEIDPLPWLAEVEAQVNAGLRKEILANWYERYISIAGEEALRGLRVGVFEGSTAAAGPLAKLLGACGADVYPFGKCDTFTPLDTEAVEDRLLEQLGREIESGRLDAVVSADPDGDRPLVIDDEGEIVRGDLLGWLTARWLSADAVVTTVTANSRVSSEPGCNVRRTRVGSPYVIAGLLEEIAAGAKRPIGFEPNGGVLVGSDQNVRGRMLCKLVTRDSFLPILAVLQQSAGQKKPLSELRRLAAFRSAASGRLQDVDTSRCAELVKGLSLDEDKRARFFAPYGSVRSIDTTDGLRVILGTSDIANRDCIVHLRPSGNAPEMRCYVEAETDARAGELLTRCLSQLRLQLG
jgi:phosphomannomutase